MKRAAGNPILTRTDVPAVRRDLVDVSSVFNPGAVRVDGRDRLLLRVQTRGRRTVLMVADETGPDTARFEVRPSVVEIDGLEPERRGLYHVYDPRLTALDGCVYVVFAADTDGGCRLGVARATTALERFELVHLEETGDARNGVLFPERIEGRYLRLERPNEVVRAGEASTGDQIVLAASDDLRSWRRRGPVMTGRPRYWDERIGSGPPPVKTRAGWLHVYHGVATHFAACNIYQAGVVLLDLEDPRRVLGRSRLNLLEPREPWELTGQVPNVVFPSGLTTDDADAEGFIAPEASVRVYYGAADTCVGLAETTVRALLDECE